jgi:methionyl-tRNA formyltransferase
LILPGPILEAPLHGCLNVHASLLPRWRGAAPIQRAILAGDADTGVDIMQMEAGLDTGPVRLRYRTPIGYKTAGDLATELSGKGAELMVEVLRDFDRYPPVPQPEIDVTYATKVEKAEAQIDWTAGAVAVVRQVQAFNPTPGAWFEFGGERIKVLKANIQSAIPNPPFDFTARFTPGLVLDGQLAIGCGVGAVRPDLVQRAGRGVMTAQELLRGFPIPAGTQL